MSAVWRVGRLFRRRFTVAFPALLACCLWSAPARGAESGRFPASVEFSDQNLEKTGEFRYVYRFVFPLYEAALFVPPEAEPKELLDADYPFHLRFHYLRDIKKAIILKSADRMLEKNLSSEERASIRSGIEKLNEKYVSVREGDESSLTYIPDRGTTLRVNGESKVTIEGRDFDRLYFEIWFGERPISADLKKTLLGE